MLYCFMWISSIFHNLVLIFLYGMECSVLALVPDGTVWTNLGLSGMGVREYSHPIKTNLLFLPCLWAAPLAGTCGSESEGISTSGT